MYEIRKVPAEVVAALREGDRHGVKKYPFAEMAVGDSFEVAAGDEAKKAKSAMRAFAGRNAVRFVAVPAADKVTIVRVA